MAVASGSCPSCGAPIEFTVGASVSRVCDHCKSTVFRSDRGLEDLGKVAAIANVPSLIAVGDQGTLGGRPFRVLGRVQLDHGAGPWDEYYVAFENGAAWGWLAYAEGVWYVTEAWPGGPPVPQFERLHIEMDVSLGQAGMFRVAEVKTGRVVSAQGELPARLPPGLARRYVDLFGVDPAFATFDYGDGTGAPEIFLGRRFDESGLSITAAGPRTVAKVSMATIRCPNCGGDLPKLSGERAERVGCRYCGAISDVAEQRVISAQDAARLDSPIPLGTTGTIGGVSYTAIACIQRDSEIDGERFSWVELLLFAQGVGFRWLVRDESTWLFVVPVNLAELDLRQMPRAVRLRGGTYRLRNRNVARVDYVLGEVYWKCEVGETTRASDYVAGPTVLSREESPGEVRWSYSSPIPWPVIAQAFGLSRNRPGAAVAGPSAGGSHAQTAVVVLVVVFILMGIAFQSLFDGGGGSSGGGVFGGSGYYYGGK
ncbi:MAG TPA: DUF4178 domain-containing protein [Polyangiaceae bacterium]|jgi:uncharacterized membrane protein YgcG|nr:DUF4178 domain-containing protein [Polyangiaceae bacterium]